ncbi:MAG: hypothetical protein A3C11_03070 [Candidatus Sungbacteria bacterium RIFCSPHIGHO2_02_FULL_49_12]|uniref:50S ribosomal protein L35 n=1 Tax=Candidatus Sungbacteria bacterium RIFCSPHIGHO2_02_FULL_49_12 TaxID=1802271 RepID=A0A1G2KSW0_9BACT|nr:MAG: hypothetical protein A3C11_03070 [Candidatus Sungbacteria bacterium RIFCSPHIGHO2_02_FULL_49_12]
MIKTRKSITKRFKVTSSGKLLRRVARKNHFNAKKRRATQLRGSSMRVFTGVDAKKVRAGLPHS